MKLFFKKYFLDEIKIRQKILEESVLIASILKWTFFAVIVGSAVGVSTGVFLYLLGLTTNFVTGFNYYYLLLLKQSTTDLHKRIIIWKYLLILILRIY